MKKLNHHNLVKSLNSLCGFLHDTYSVNYGGCCFLAYLIAQHFDKLNIKYNLVIYDNSQKDKINIEHEVISCHKNKGFSNSVIGRYSCCHYCLQLEGAGIINEKSNDYCYIIPNVSYKNIKWIYKNGSWNDIYEIRHNKTIRNIVKEFFKEYEEVPFN